MNSGIYSITNKENNKIYIGSSVNISNRWRVHKSRLKNNKHENPHLQSAWNMYGEDRFNFKIVKMAEKEELLTIEQLYLDIAKQTPLQYYNVNYIAKCPPSFKGKKRSEAFKLKVSIGNKGKRLGKVGRFDKTIYTFNHRETNAIFRGLQRDFYKEFNLDNRNICNLIKGKIKSYKNWVIKTDI